MLSILTGSSGESLSNVLKNDRASLTSNPIRLIKLVQQEVTVLADKAKNIETQFSKNLLNPETSVFGSDGKDKASDASKSPLTFIGDFIKSIDPIMPGIPTTDVKEKVVAILNGFDTLKNHLANNSMVPSGCMFGLVACCLLSILKDLENNAKEEWAKLYAEAKDNIEQFREKLGTMFIEACSELKAISVEAVQEIKKSLLKGCDMAKNFPNDIRQAMEEIAKKHLHELTNVSELMKHVNEKNFLSTQFEQLHTELKQVFQKFTQQYLNELVGNLLKSVVNFITKVVKIVKDLLSQSFDIIIEIFDKVIEFVKSAPERVRNIFDFSDNCAASMCLSAPRDLIDSTLDQIKQALASVPSDKVAQSLRDLKKSCETIKTNTLDEWTKKMAQITNIETLMGDLDKLFTTFDSDMDEIKKIVAEIEEKGMNLTEGKFSQVIDKVSKTLDNTPLGVIKKLF